MLTGFDSESDRRDAIRKQTVETSVTRALQTIRDNLTTDTPEERRYLEMAVASRLLEGLRLEMMSQMLRAETDAALKRIDD